MKRTLPTLLALLGLVLLPGILADAARVTPAGKRAEPSASTSTPSASEGNDPFSSVREMIRTRLIARSIPSLAVAVARDGKILWEEGFGWADRENRVPATEHTTYSLASISKPITATGLMVLKERGKLDLDRPINDYLGEAKLKAWVGDPAAATVRRVANHTSGLPLHWQFFPDDEPRRPPSMDETIRRYGNLVTIPGERWQYSNLGFGLLDYVIERLSGKSYADFMRQEVFVPLGMTHSSVGIGPGLEKYAAARYDGDGARLPFYDFDHRGGSAVFCSAHDLVRFGMFHLKAHLSDQKAILTDESIDAMQMPTGKTGDTSGYGIGWFVDEELKEYRTVSHGGGMPGVSTSLTLMPSQKLAVAVLTNASANLSDQVNDKLISLLVPELSQKRTQARAEQRRKRAPAPKREPGSIPTAALFGEWRGSVHTYQGDLPLTFWFKESGDVHVRLGSQLKTLLNNVRFQDEALSGEMLGDIGTDDANRHPYHLFVGLKRWGEVLNGAITAITSPGKWFGSALSHWAEVKKVP
jgi:CubicO group peptidase (beta-lactamase class C family)